MIVLLVAALLAPLLPVVEASQQPAGKLPTAVAGTSAVWTGADAYIFGGATNPHGVWVDRIFRYDPETGLATTMNARLPTGRYGTSAVWTGQYAYIFGGYDGGFRDTILRYDPVTDLLVTLTAKLPAGTHWTSAVWTGQHAYIIGGWDPIDSIVRFDPQTGAVQTMGAKLPTARGMTASVYMDGSIYIFGGNNYGGPIDEILRYDVATDSIVTLPTKLPTPRGQMSAVINGASVELYGGNGATTDSQIVRFTPAMGTITAAPALWSNRDATSAVTTGGVNLVFGGEDRWEGTRYDDVWAVTADNSMPCQVRPSPLPNIPLHSDEPCPAPEDWSEHTLLSWRMNLTEDGGRVPGLDMPVAGVHGRPRQSDPRYYDLTASVAGQPSRSISLYTSGVAGLPEVSLDLINIPPTATNYSVLVELKYRTPPQDPVCLAASGDTCLAGLAADPTAPEWQSSADDAIVIVRVSLRNPDGETVESRYLSIPYAGAALELVRT